MNGAVIARRPRSGCGGTSGLNRGSSSRSRSSRASGCPVTSSRQGAYSTTDQKASARLLPSGRTEGDDGHREEARVLWARTGNDAAERSAPPPSPAASGGAGQRGETGDRASPPEGGRS